MADTYQNIIQFKNASANTLEAAYTVPSATVAKIGSLTVCNKSDTADVVDITHAIAGAADADKQYIFSQLPLGARETVTLEKLIILAATDVLRFKSQNGTSVINGWGVLTT